GSRNQSCYMSRLLAPAQSLIFLRNGYFAVKPSGNQYSVINIQKTLTGHSVESGARLFPFELIVEYKRY
ncbi:MAG TPA: hypothetical protein VE133_06110, partial [Candidatus Sulfotelmatobacter sp.]|nr:hypothetical protein [Candidatus Sulfotelmatobacter sp.]